MTTPPPTGPPADPRREHPPTDLVARWASTSLAGAARAPGAVVPMAPLDEGAALGVEAHLDRCPTCRAVADVAARDLAPDRLEDGWWSLVAELDAPRPGPVERALRRLRVPADVARLLVATPTLRRAWFVAMAVALVFGLAAADPDRTDASELLFLVLAPLIPVAGVALAYGPGVDPAHEVTVATPTSGLRLVLIRTLAVVSVSTAATGAAAVVVAEVSPRAGAWLVPALALSAVCLAAGTWVTPRVAGALTSAAWLAAVAVANGAADDRFAAFGVGPQVLWAVVGLIAGALVVVRRRAFDVLGVGA